MGGSPGGDCPRPALRLRAGGHPGESCSAGAGLDSLQARQRHREQMDGRQVPSAPPAAIRTGAGREGGGGRERRKGGGGGWAAGRCVRACAARACPGAGLGLAEARAGTGGRVETRSAALRRGAEGWVLVCLRGCKVQGGCRWRGFSKEDVKQAETPVHPSNPGSLGRAVRARGAPGPRGVGRGGPPLTRRFPETRGWGEGWWGRQAGPLRLPPVGWGGRGLRLWPCRLWVPRNSRTLPESFQSVKCLGEVVVAVVGCQEWGGAVLGPGGPVGRASFGGGRPRL